MRKRFLAAIAALASILLVSSGAVPAGAAQTRKIRVGVATFEHETCTFCPDPTGITEWENYGPPVRGDAVLRMGPYIQGFAAAAREYDGVELVGILSLRESKGGSSGSWITREAFDKYANGIAGDLERQGPFDGVYGEASMDRGVAAGFQRDEQAATYQELGCLRDGPSPLEILAIHWRRPIHSMRRVFLVDSRPKDVPGGRGNSR